MKIIEIKCRFCGTKTGQQSFPNIPPGQVITQEELGVLDSRCESCEATNGNFKEMSMFYHDKVNGDTEMQKEYMTKSQYKIDKFVDNLIFDHPESIFGNGVPAGQIKQKRDEKVSTIGIDDLGDVEKVDLVNRYKENHKSDQTIDSAKAETIKREIINEKEAEAEAKAELEK